MVLSYTEASTGELIENVEESLPETFLQMLPSQVGIRGNATLG